MTVPWAANNEPRTGTPLVDGHAIRGPIDTEVDGNRTRRTGIARPNRFEGGGAHQVRRHLRRRR
jgi:hypothetical protein